MAKKKTEEVTEEVMEQEEPAKQKKTEEVTEDMATANADYTEDKKEPIARSTPFGIEMWDPETMTTTMKPNG